MPPGEAAILTSAMPSPGRAAVQEVDEREDAEDHEDDQLDLPERGLRRIVRRSAAGDGGAADLPLRCGYIDRTGLFSRYGCSTTR
jgi:hypothetical protein